MVIDGDSEGMVQKSQNKVFFLIWKLIMLRNKSQEFSQVSSEDTKPNQTSQHILNYAD